MKYGTLTVDHDSSIGEIDSMREVRNCRVDNQLQSFQNATHVRFVALDRVGIPPREKSATDPT